MKFDTVAILGVGLLGGSVGAALRERKLAKRIVGIGRNLETLATAKALGLATETTTDIAQGVRTANLVVVATPVDMVIDHVRLVREHCSAATLITDCGSTKREIVKHCTGKSNQQSAIFVGSHPLAGGEKSGPTAARADLFDGRKVIVTPGKDQSNDDPAVQAVAEFWAALGATTFLMTPAEHDRALAITSHLPHVVAAALAKVTPAADLPLTATGWRGTTRVAAGDAELWTQIVLSNHDNLLKSLNKYQQSLSQFIEAIERQDARQIRTWFTQAKERRDAVES
jgi:prephenate dehydrogenase